MKIEDVYRDFYGKLVDHRLAKETKLPDMIWHYTNTEGLLGILKSRELWASNARYMNDYMELKFGINFFCNKLSNESERTDSKEYSDIVNRIIEYLLSSDINDTYVLSFSSEKDLLSQWKGYGSDAGSFSIGFDTNTFGLLLSPVRYSLTEHEYAWDYFVEYLNSLFTHYQKYPTDENALGLIGYAASAVEFEAATIKHSSFSEEREFRSYYFESDENPEVGSIQIRAKKSSLVPFIPIKLESLKTLKSIKEIIIGPHHRPDMQKSALDKYLTSLNVDIDITSSDIPYLI